ncbi:Metallo-beta-lactamase superfamily protein [Actinopolyspora lacussalsi subsp. righensis]|uniref:Metallo-beta-lactamase superfamily protein n=1 Tax=Actinopolyspora righensis TaxID=995060 RepID=A0A1I6X6Y7_9ACTN|nr:alkyl sulfatase dimerization domain-containing protein [Actinopolyspora righensis]SFT33671.1 Metallo-beta-lactamase superfamily protein [Actinopolyspora righensis]
MSSIHEFAERCWNGEASTLHHLGGEQRAAELHRMADGVWMWPGFGNVYVFPTERGIVLFDTGSRTTASELHAAVRRYWSLPLHTAIYSHGHVDHVFGTEPFEREAADNGDPAPTVLAHEAITARFDRYRRSAGYNTVVNRRQFRAPELNWPTDYRYPDATYRDSTELRVGELDMRLHHVLGETDDHTVAWLPEREVLCVGDLFIWASPNAGNPQKPQRHPLEWAQGLRWMAELEPRLLLPGHGVPIEGHQRVRQALTDTAELLESLHDQVLELMNTGACFDEVLHRVSPPEHLLRKPYLRPIYDEPEFVVHALWQRYGGWWDGDPARLKPAPRPELAAELAALVGGAERLATRARELGAAEQPRLAAHLAQLAGDAAPHDPEIHRQRMRVFRELEREAGSTMARGIYGWAVAESEAVVEGGDAMRALERAARQRPTGIEL